MATVRVTALPADPLGAAAAFHGEWLPRIREELAASADESSVLIFPPAEHSHRGWRLAAVQELARELAPRRVNALACDSVSGEAAALALLAECQGLTGQLMAIDPTGVVEAAA